jgi:maleamate amidohydrolase
MAKADITDAGQDYAAAGFGGDLPWGRRPALLLVDFAAAYFVPGSPLFAGVEAERAVAAHLAAAARAAAIPVIFTRVEYEPGVPGRDGGLFYRKIRALTVFDRGNPLGDFTPELAPRPGDIVITKQWPSSFFRTGLADRLRDLGVDTLLITGLSTSGCVRASALDALCEGFVPIVIEDACGDRDSNVQAANLFDLAAKTANVVRSPAVLAYLASLSESRTDS